MKNMLKQMIIENGIDQEYLELKSTIRSLQYTLVKKGVMTDLINYLIDNKINDSYLKACKNLAILHMGLSERAIAICEYRDLGSKIAGFHNYEDKTVVLNDKLSLTEILEQDSDIRLKQMINTLLHEFRHAWQHRHNPSILENYINYSDNKEGYENHPCEVDAREYAKNNTDIFLNLMKEHIGYILNIIAKDLNDWLICEQIALMQINACKNRGEKSTYRLGSPLTKQEILAILARKNRREIQSRRDDRRSRTRPRTRA